MYFYLDKYMQGFLTDSGLVNPERVQLIMQDLGEMEDSIFKERQERELQFRARNKAKKRRELDYQNRAPKWTPDGVCAPKPLMGINHRATNVRQEAAEMRVAGMNNSGGFGQHNSVHKKLETMDNSDALKKMMVGGEASHNQGVKRGHDQVINLRKINLLYLKSIRHIGYISSKKNSIQQQCNVI